MRWEQRQRPTSQSQLSAELAEESLQTQLPWTKPAAEDSADSSNPSTTHTSNREQASSRVSVLLINPALPSQLREIEHITDSSF